MSNENPVENTVENQNEKKISDIINSAIQNFVQEKLSENIDFFSEQIFYSNIIYDNFKDYLENSRDDYSNYISEYNNINLDEKKKLRENIKKEVVKQKVWMNKNIATVKKAIKNEFDIKNEMQLDSELKKVYSEENWKEKIKNILTKQISRHWFLKTHLEWNYELKNNNQEQKEDEDLFSNIEWLNIDELSEEQKETLKKMYLSQQTLDTDDLIKFLNFLSPKNRNSVLKYFNPTISLEDLVKYDVIKKIKAFEILEKSLKNIEPKIPKKDLQNIFNKNWNLKDIYINIDDLEEREILNFLETKEAFQPIVDELNSMRKTFERDNTEKFYNNELLNIDDNWKIHNNFKDFIKKNSELEIWTDVKNSIDNFSKWNYIKVNSWKTDTYYYIEEIDLWWTKAWKHILIKNLSSKYWEWVRDKQYVQEEIMTYDELYRLFKASNKLEWAKVEFIENTDFQNLWLKEPLEEENIQSEEQLKKLLKEEWFLDESLLNTPLKDLKLKDKEKWEEFYRFFKSSNDNKHSLTFEGTEQEMLYSDFFGEFKRQKTKWKKLQFEKKINNLEEFINNSRFLKKQKIVLHKSWKKLVYKEDKNSEVEKWIEHFIADTGETISINKINEDSIEFSTWKFISKVKNKGEDWKTKDKDWITTTIEQKILYNWDNNFDYFQLLIDNWKEYKAENYDVKNKVEDKKSKEKPFKEKGSIIWAWFSMASITEIIQWWEMMINAIKEYLERWNDLKAAQFAQLFGWMLPEEVKSKLQFNTTEKRKEIVDKIFKQLNEQNALDAWNYIVNKILNNKHASKEEIFAAIKYMMLKRGSLYWKPFVWRESEYIWYQKLGWDLNSTEFKKWERDAKNKDRENAVVWKKDPSFLVEESLLENVILKRLWKDWKSLYPRVEKDFNKYISEWQEKRYTKWENETAAAFTITEKTDNFVNQLKWWEKSRAMWAVSKILSKNSTGVSMHFPGFLLSMSWYTKNFNPSELNKIGKEAYTTPSTSLLFWLSENWIEIYQNIVINYFEDKNPKKANKLRDILKEPTVKRIEALETFWWNNQTDLMNFLNMKDWVIPLKKWTKEDKWWYYEKYFEILKWEFDSWEFNYKKDDYLHTWKFWDTSLTEVWSEEGLKHYLKTSQNLSHITSDSKHFAHMYLHRLKDIKTNKFNHSEEEQKKLFKITYSVYEKNIRNIIWSFLDKTDLKTNQWGIPKELRQYNLLLNYWENKRENYDDFIDHAFEHFINNDIKENNLGNKWENDIKRTTSNSIIEIMNADEDFKKTA